MLDLDAAEIRVLGCLLEKQRTTPDTYPLTLNALRLACNQATNRDPVLDLDEATVRAAAQKLGQRGFARMASGHGSRSPKYRHLLEEALPVSRAGRALLCVLMLRGPQTPGELKGRVDRLQDFAGLDAVEAELASLAEQGFARRLERRPGEKQTRWEQLLGGGSADEADATASGASDGGAARAGVADTSDLAAQVAELRGRVDALEARLSPGG